MSVDERWVTFAELLADHIDGFHGECHCRRKLDELALGVLPSEVGTALRAETPAASLDEAWAEAEAALPEGWSIWWLQDHKHINGGWDACAGWDGATNPTEALTAAGDGATPQEALRALARQLLVAHPLDRTAEEEGNG